VPVLGLAISPAARVDIARTLVDLSRRDAFRAVLREKISRGVTERINAVLWVSRSARFVRDQRKHRGPTRSFRFFNDYAQAAIDAIHDAGGDVLN